AETTRIIPGTLPYDVAGVTSEGAYAPETLLHRGKLVVRDAGGVLLSVEAPLHQWVGHRTVIGYKAATRADEELIADSGGLYEAPAVAVNVLPVVRVDGREIASATRAVGLG